MLRRSDGLRRGSNDWRGSRRGLSHRIRQGHSSGRNQREADGPFRRQRHRLVVARKRARNGGRYFLKRGDRGRFGGRRRRDHERGLAGIVVRAQSQRRRAGIGLGEQRRRFRLTIDRKADAEPDGGSGFRRGGGLRTGGLRIGGLRTCRYGRARKVDIGAAIGQSDGFGHLLPDDDGKLRFLLGSRLIGQIGPQAKRDDASPPERDEPRQFPMSHGKRLPRPTQDRNRPEDRKCSEPENARL